MPASTLWVLVYHYINSKNIKTFCISHASFFIHLIRAFITSIAKRHLQEATKSFHFLMLTPLARKHIKLENFWQCNSSLTSIYYHRKIHSLLQFYIYYIWTFKVLVNDIRPTSNFANNSRQSKLPAISLTTRRSGNPNRKDQLNNYLS